MLPLQRSLALNIALRPSPSALTPTPAIAFARNPHHRTMKITLVLALAVAVVTGEIINNKHLKTEVITPKECKRKTQAGDSIHVHYRGTLEKDGSEFDSSYGRGSPLAFTVGKGQVIKGWDQGLLDMCPGEKRKLTIQPDWAYGSRGAGPIGPNSVLIFESELVSIDGVETEKVEL
ncbi:hypothetical protein P3342_011113 [Pyrenophora teres f. teres]|nr:hypothetical protein P3342_011113 [Pyrenophora teres f. teres]